MAEVKKSVVVDIISDSKKFLSGFEEAIKAIEKTAKKTDILGGMQDEIDAVKEDIKNIETSLSHIKPSIDNSAIIDMQKKIEKLSTKIKNLKADVKNIKIDVDTNTGKTLIDLLQKANEELTTLKEQSQVLKGLGIGLDTNNVNKSIEDIKRLRSSVEQLTTIKNELKATSSISFDKLDTKQAISKLEELEEKYKEIIKLDDSDKKNIDLARVAKKIDFLQKKTGKILIPSNEIDSVLSEAEDILKNRIEKMQNTISKLSSNIGSDISKFELKDGKISVKLDLDTTVNQLKNLVFDTLSQVQESVTTKPITVPLRFTSNYKTKVNEELEEVEKVIQGMKNSKTKGELTKQVENLRKQILDRDFKLEFSTNLPDLLNNIINPNISEIQKVLKNANLYLYPQLKLDTEAEKTIREQVEKICAGLKIDLGVSNINLDTLISPQEIERINEELKKLSVTITPKVDLTDADIEKINKNLLSKINKLNIEVDTKKLQEGIKLAVDTTLIDNWKNKFVSAISEVCTKIEKSFGKVTRNQFYDAMKGWSEADTIMRKHRKGYNDKYHKVNTTNEKNANGELERKAYANFQNGTISNSYIVDQFASVSGEIKVQLKKLYENVKQIGDIYDTTLHSHPVHNGIGSDLTFSPADIRSYNYERLNEGIKKLMIESNGKINELDLSTVDNRIVAAIVKKYEQKLDKEGIPEEIKNTFLTKNKDGKVISVDYSKRAEYTNAMLSEIISNEINKFNKKNNTNYDANVSNYLKQYDIEQLRFDPKELAKEEQEIDNLVKLLIQMSSTLTEINKKNIQIDEKSIKNIVSQIQKLVEVTKELNIQFKNFGVNTVNISEKPFENITNTIQNLSDMLQRTFNMISNEDISNQWGKINTAFSSLIKEDGSFDARKKEVKELIAEYQKYINMGGKNPITDLTSNENSQKKLTELFKKQSEQQEDLKGNVKGKNELFEEENKIVNETIPKEVQKVDELRDSLVKIENILKEINISTKGINFPKLKDLINIEDLDSSKIEKIVSTLTELFNKINDLKFEDTTFINSINEILSKTDELKNLASILKESKKKIDSVKNVATNTQLSTTNLSTTTSNSNNQSSQEIITENEKVANALVQVEQARKEAYEEPERYEGEVIDDTHELMEVYQKAKEEYQKGSKSYQQAYEDMRKGFEQFYAKEGFDYSSVDINLDSSFGFKNANIKVFNDQLKQTIVDYYRLDKESQKIVRTGIHLKDNGTQRAQAIKKENNLIEKASENLKKYLADFDNKTLFQMQDNSIYKQLSSFNIADIDDIEKAKTLMIQLDTVYTNIMTNARKGTTGLNPFVNMVSNIDKAKNALTSIKIFFKDLSYDTGDLQEKINKLEETLQNVEKAQGIEAKSKFYGDFKQQLNLISNDLQTQHQQESKVNDLLAKQKKSLNNIYDLRAKIEKLKSSGKNNEAITLQKELDLEKQNYSIIGKELEAYEQILSNENRRVLIKQEAKKAELQLEKVQSQIKDSNNSQFQQQQEKEINEHNKNVISKYKELQKNAKDYYDLSEKKANNTATETELKLLKKLNEEWIKAIGKEEEYYIQEGGDSSIKEQAQKIQEKFINSQGLNYSKIVDNYLQEVKQKISDITKNTNFTDDFMLKITNAKELIREISSKLTFDILDESDFAQVRKLKDLIEKIDFGKNDKLNLIANPISVIKLQRNIYAELEKNSAMSKEFREELEALGKQLAALGYEMPKEEFDKFTIKFVELQKEVNKAGKLGKSFFSLLSSKIKGMNASFFATYFSMQDWIRYGQEIFRTIKEYDDALTEMKKVSEESIQVLQKFQKESFNLANNIGTTAEQIQNSTADYLRLGYSLEQASQLAEDANIYANVGDMGIDEATEHMISSVQAWKSEFKNEIEASEAIVDRYNEIGNNFAISSADIGEAMERSAAAMKAGGNDLNEALGLLVAGNVIQQDAETTGAALKVLSLRIRGAKADLEEMGEETDDLADSTSKMREELKALTGVDIMLDENTFKSTAEIIKEMGENWSKMTDVSQAAALEKIAGKNRSSTIAGLIENYKLIDEVIATAENADGSALKENEAYLESIQGKLNLLKNSWDNLWINDNNREVITFFLDLAKGILDVVNNIGVLKTALIGGGGIFGIYKSIQGDGRQSLASNLNMPSVIVPYKAYRIIYA